MQENGAANLQQQKTLNYDVVISNIGHDSLFDFVVLCTKYYIYKINVSWPKRV